MTPVRALLSVFIVHNSFLLRTISGCSGTISGPCTAATLGAVSGCSVFSEEERDMACKLAGVPFGDIVNRYYQFDKEFLDGGGHYNDKTDSDIDRQMDTFRISTFETNMAGSTRISWPYYEALEGYAADRELADGPLMSNFRDCDSNAVLCCTTSSRGNTFTPNADVCHVNMADSRRSAHVYHGEAHFTGSDHAYCQGFTWEDDTIEDRFKGNMLYDISYKHFQDTGYVKNVPGAAMCGCADQMPVVTNAVCKSVSVSGEAYVVTTETMSDGTNKIVVTSASSTSVTVSNCAGGSSEETALAAITVDECDETREAFYNEHFYVPAEAGYDPFTVKPSTAEGVTWSKVAGQGLEFLPDVDYLDYDKRDTDFRALLASSRTGIIHRHCPTCLPSHQRLFLKFKTGIPTPDQVNLLDLFLNDWRDRNNQGLTNVLNVNFVLYNDYYDCLNDTENPETMFTYCNYNSNNVGFPRDCGLRWKTDCQWNNYNGNKNVCGGYYAPTTTAFYVDVTP